MVTEGRAGDHDIDALYFKIILSIETLVDNTMQISIFRPLLRRSSKTQPHICHICLALPCHWIYNRNSLGMTLCSRRPMQTRAECLYAPFKPRKD
jgi:hypothetical protein